MTTPPDHRETALRRGDDRWGRPRRVLDGRSDRPLAEESAWDAFGSEVASDIDGDHYAGHLAAYGAAVS